MGMTDKQFNDCVRLLLEEMESVKNEENSEKKEKSWRKSSTPCVRHWRIDLTRAANAALP